MKKWVTAVLALIVLTTIIVLLILPKGFTGKAIFTPPIPTECSDESIKSAWDSIFYKSSEAITIRSAALEKGYCNSFIAYSIAGKEMHILVGFTTRNESQRTIKFSAGHGSFNDLAINKIKAFDNLVPDEDYSLLALGSLTTANIDFRPSENNNSNQTFMAVFKMQPLGNWIADNKFPQREYFEDQESTEQRMIFNAGSVIKNYSLETAYVFAYVYEGDNCISDWNCTDWAPERCSSGEQQTRKCTDSNKCLAPNNAGETSRSCKNNGLSIWVWTSIVLGSLIIIAGIIIGIIAYKKRKGRTNKVPSPKQDSQKDSKNIASKLKSAFK
jgi:hypothetical protein